jgi:hypothetical protein
MKNPDEIKWVKEYVMETVSINSKECIFTTYTKLLHGLSRMGDVYRLSDPDACGDALFSLTNSGIIKAHTKENEYIAFMKSKENFKAHLYKYSIGEAYLKHKQIESEYGI